MSRARQAQKAERLNRARKLLQRFEELPDAVERLAEDCAISPRQALSDEQSSCDLRSGLFESS
jgi:predicted DNA-binding transcriptional regulator YafY